MNIDWLRAASDEPECDHDAPEEDIDEQGHAASPRAGREIAP